LTSAPDLGEPLGKNMYKVRMSITSKGPLIELISGNFRVTVYSDAKEPWNEKLIVKNFGPLRDIRWK